MSNKIKEISIKNHTYCFFNDIINIKKIMIQIKLEIKIDEKSYKTFLFTTLDM